MRKLIRADGTEVELPAPVSMATVEQMIDAEILGTVRLRHMGAPLHLMLLDDNGYDSEMVELSKNHFMLQPVRARKPVNRKATDLYWANCREGTTHEIVGDVVVVPDSDFPADFPQE